MISSRPTTTDLLLIRGEEHVNWMRWPTIVLSQIHLGARGEEGEGTMRTLDVRRLMTLRAVRDAGGVLAAAEALHISASAAAQQVSKLEREAGVQLLDRLGPGRARLTAAGERLCEHADVIAATLRMASRELSEHADLRD